MINIEEEGLKLFHALLRFFFFFFLGKTAAIECLWQHCWI